jgi:hypothetical protein
VLGLVLEGVIVIECFLYGLIGMSLIVALLAVVAWLDSINYAQWQREFEEKGGIQWPVEVLDGSDVVSHTVMVERRSNRV